MSTKQGRKVIRDYVLNAAWDHEYTPWGSGMGALMILTDAAFYLGVEVPAEIAEPAPSMVEGGDWINFEEFEVARDLVSEIEGQGAVSTDDLEYGIRWVNRYLGLPMVAARRY